MGAKSPRQGLKLVVDNSRRHLRRTFLRRIPNVRPPEVAGDPGPGLRPLGELMPDPTLTVANAGKVALGRAEPSGEALLREAVLRLVRVNGIFEGHRSNMLDQHSDCKPEYADCVITPIRARCDPSGMAKGNQIAALRKARGMSQDQLGALVGLDQSQVSKLENGVYELTAQRINAIADALGVHPGELFRPLPEPEPEDKIAMEVARALSPSARAAWFSVGREMSQPREPARQEEESRPPEHSA